LAGALALCATPAVAQSFDGASPEPAALGCYYTFSSGSGAALVSYCLTENGNVVKLEAPAGQNHNPGGSGEGYVICSAAGVHGYDLGSWIPVPLGPTTLVWGAGSSWTLQRDTTDGVFRLIQKFTWNTKEREINIDQTLVNLTGTTATNVVLARVSRWGVNNDYLDDRGDVSSRTAWLADADMVSINASTLTVPASTHVVFDFPSGCAAKAVATPAPPGNYALQTNYDLGNLGPLKKKTVRVQIRVQ